MRKNLLRSLCFILMLSLFTVPAFADMGPKPSVVVDFAGIPEGTAYYVTLLAEEASTGPWNVGNPIEMRGIEEKFFDYSCQDPEFYFLGCYNDCTETNQFIWACYPPEHFKILIYFLETDTFAVTDEVFEQYAFDSCFDAEYHGDGTLTAKRSLETGLQMVAFLVRLALTVAVELLIARLLGFRGRQLLLILGVNVFTQLLLNLTLMREFEPSFFWYITLYWVLEFLVALLEGTIYLVFLPKLGEVQEKSLPMFYALAANLVSFLLGWLISHPFPYLF